MKKIKVYVKYCVPYEEWGETFGGDILGVRTMDTLLKTDIPEYLPQARKYVRNQLKNYTFILKKNEAKRVEMKASLKQLGPFRNPEFEKEYNRIRMACNNTARMLKRYKKIIRNDWETVKIYKRENENIEYQEYEIEIPDSILEDVQ